MCQTCGCSTDAEPTIAMLGAEGAGGAHHRDHGGHEPHRHTHDHAHPHEHSHPHEHGDHDHGSPPEPAAPAARTIRIEENLLAKNDRLAERNRGGFAASGIVALNLMSSPGAGKTTLLERTIRDLGDELAISVIEGDQETVRDAARIRATGCRVVQINTGSGCHLDASMIAAALPQLAPPPGSLLLIENVGNLVCPALFDLGERCKVVIASVTEGEDKPLKYPHMFRAAELMLLNKVDLLPHLHFDVADCLRYARQVNPSLRVIEVSATHGDGLELWYDWLRAQARQGAETPALAEAPWQRS